MEHQLHIYNTLSRTKELFRPIHPGRVGMYVCGPTVYGDAHLGHARPAITFDLLFRYLRHTGYKVRYVRNITDVGHLEHDADEGEDKIAKKARIEQLEPMEVAQFYTNRFDEAMKQLNVLPPSIEPHATGHIIEQIQLIQQILDAGYAYESNGSVYFDVVKFDQDYKYGVLSGRNLEEVRDASRELDGVGEKRHQVDSLCGKKRSLSTLCAGLRRGSEGFPGWHCECTAMGRKYLGEEFDIHGGGMDLIFPHHECEIAQAVASQQHQMVRYWMHNNMITINGQKDGQVAQQLHYVGAILHRQPRNLRTGLFAYDHSLLHSVCSLPRNGRLLERSPTSCTERIRKTDERHRGFETHSDCCGKRREYQEVRCGIAPEVLRCDERRPYDTCCHLKSVRGVPHSEPAIDHKAQISEEDLKELSETMRLFAFDILGW